MRMEFRGMIYLKGEVMLDRMDDSVSQLEGNIHLGDSVVAIDTEVMRESSSGDSHGSEVVRVLVPMHNIAFMECYS
jgi:hypothetical protein